MSALLLDTHIWLWFAEGNATRLPPASVRKLDDARKEDGLLVSAISVWEIGVLHAKGRVQLSAPLRDWVNNALAPAGISLLPLDAETASESTLLRASFTAIRLIGSLLQPPAPKALSSQHAMRTLSTTAKPATCVCWSYDKDRAHARLTHTRTGIAGTLQIPSAKTSAHLSTSAPTEADVCVSSTSFEGKTARGWLQLVWPICSFAHQKCGTVTLQVRAFIISDECERDSERWACLAAIVRTNVLRERTRCASAGTTLVRFRHGS